MQKITLPTINSPEQYIELCREYSIKADHVPAMVAFHERLRLANEHINLTRLIEPEDFWTYHVLDTLSLLLVCQHNNIPIKKYLDIGSGCGVPGVLLSIMTGARVTLCESVQKKAKFLAETVSELNLKARISPVRAESLGKDYQLVTARAVCKPELLPQLCENVLMRGGVLLAQTTDSFGLQSRDQHRFRRGGEYELALGTKSRRVTCLIRK